ncbi:MAG: 30S ribosomal protein S2, partial [Actinobacteria bacterium]|nr:30S ribosomal protein S2 [Actinomycetota bacterium]
LDTNADPDEVDFGIPANDDAIRSVDLMCQLMADAILAGSGVVVEAEEMAATPSVDLSKEAEAAAEVIEEELDEEIAE